MNDFRIPKGSIVFQNDRTSVYSKAINLQTTIDKRFTQRGTIGHVAIGMGDLLNQSLILEADNTIVDVNFAKKYEAPEHYLEVFNLSKFTHHARINKALEDTTQKYMLQKYGKAQIAGFALEVFLKPFGFKKNPFPNGIICSELGFYYLEALGYGRFFEHEPDPNMITPTDLYEVCVRLFGDPEFVKDYDSASWRFNG